MRCGLATAVAAFFLETVPVTPTPLSIYLCVYVRVILGSDSHLAQLSDGGRSAAVRVWT